MADKKSSEGKVIGGKRMCGKTTQLIKRASEESLYIVCANKDMAKIIYQQSQEMKLGIPYPITVNELPLAGYMKKVLVDESEMVLSQLIGKRVVGMSSSMAFEELPSLRGKKSSECNSKREASEMAEALYKTGISTKEAGENIANSIGNIKLAVDVTDTLKGLKAVQREAKKTTAALKELENQKDRLLEQKEPPKRPATSDLRSVTDFFNGGDSE